VRKVPKQKSKRGKKKDETKQIQEPEKMVGMEDYDSDTFYSQVYGIGKSDKGEEDKE
jgi:hypothetical protein